MRDAYDDEDFDGERVSSRDDWPTWVRLGLWGLRGRSDAMMFGILCAVLTAASLGLGFWEPLFFLGGLFAFAAWWYFACVGWVDRHGEWD